MLCTKPQCPCTIGKTIVVHGLVATRHLLYKTLIPMMYADTIEQGLQVCRLLKKIEPSEIYTVVSSADLSLSLAHVRDYSWKEELVA